VDVEDLGDLVADQVVHGLDVKPLGEALLDAVDDRQLGSPLVRLAEQPLRLVEQPGVLEGDAHARGERREEALVRLAEGIDLRLLHGDYADHPVAARDRHAKERFGFGAADLDGAELGGLDVGSDADRRRVWMIRRQPRPQLDLGPLGSVPVVPGVREPDDVGLCVVERDEHRQGLEVVRTRSPTRSMIA
jgi:hypothetical protein